MTACPQDVYTFPKPFSLHLAKVQGHDEAVLPRYCRVSERMDYQTVA